MSKVNLTSGFSVVPEGKHIFKITGAKYDESFGVMEISMVIANGIKHRERFGLLDSDMQPREKAMNAFSYFVKVATQDYTNREFDTDDLVGCYIGATVKHTTQPNRNNPEKTVTFANLSDYFEANGFEGEEAAPAAAPKPASGSDFLASLGL